MRRILVLLLAGSFLITAGSQTRADDAKALIETQKALTAAQTALTSTEEALRQCQAELTKTQKALSTTEAALTMTQNALKASTDDANMCRSALSAAQAKAVELESTKKVLNEVVRERAELEAKLKVSEDKRKKSEKTLKAISEELKKCPLSADSKNARTVEPAPKSSEKQKSVVFHNRASFFCERGGMPVAFGERPPVLIYPDMTIKFDDQGEYTISFAVESPQTDVTLNLDLAVPFFAPVGTIRPCSEVRMVEVIHGSPVGGQEMALYEARVTVPPIRIRANQGEKASETTQYYPTSVWAKGNSAGLALAYGCPKGPETIHIPVGGLACGVNFLHPRRSGTATVGTIVR